MEEEEEEEEEVKEEDRETDGEVVEKEWRIWVMRGRMNELVEEEEEEEEEAVKEEAGEVGGVLEQEELDHRCPVPSLPEERREGAGERGSFRRRVGEEEDRLGGPAHLPAQDLPQNRGGGRGLRGTRPERPRYGDGHGRGGSPQDHH